MRCWICLLSVLILSGLVGCPNNSAPSSTPEADSAASSTDNGPPDDASVVETLKKHGMLLSDGGNVALTAQSDEGCADKWEDVWGPKAARVLQGIEPTDFDVLDTGPAVETTYDCVRTPY